MNPLLSEASQKNLVLASRSPRRAALLRSMGFEFEIVPAGEGVERDVSHDDPTVFPVLAARRKCDEVAAGYTDATVIAADTVVILDGEILNKPSSDDEARSHLERLSGRTHSVVTGVAVSRLGGSEGRAVEVAASEVTKVTFRTLSEDEIVRYVATGEGDDKAGSYAVQGLGACLISSIEGCYYNVVGLPIALLYDLLRKTG